jgi:hypothetical protein
VAPGLAAYWPQEALALQLELQPVPQYVGPTIMHKLPYKRMEDRFHTHHIHKIRFLRNRHRFRKAFQVRRYSPLAGFEHDDVYLDEDRASIGYDCASGGELRSVW